VRAVVLVVAVTVSCARQEASVDQGTSAGPETSDAAIREPDAGTPPTVDAGTVGTSTPDAGTADAGSEAAPTLSDAWNIQDVGGADQCSPLFGCPIPTLATNEDGQLSFGAHTLRPGPCMMCFADRLVRRWNGNAWETVISNTGWPGTYSRVSLAGDPTRGAMLFADTDLSDPYHPPIYLHVWTLDARGETEFLTPLGGAHEAHNPMLAVDATGIVTVTWTEVDSTYTSTVRSARSTSAGWDSLPEFPVPGPAFYAFDAWMVLDARGAPVVAACDAGTVQLATWELETRTWHPAPPLVQPSSTYQSCVVRALSDGDGIIVAHGLWTGPVSVDRWDGTRWTPLGRALGDNLHALARSPRGTPLLITTLGILERTDTWHVVAASSGSFPVAIASSEDKIWSWWVVGAADGMHPSVGQLRTMTLR
jgi:hypothetical protein